MYAAVFLGLGLILVFVCAKSYIEKKSAAKKSTITSGQVVDVVKEKRGSMTLYYPVVLFITADGAEKTFQNELWTDYPQYKAGDQVDVYYERTNPDNARIKKNDSGTLAVFFVVGLLLSFIGASMCIHIAKRLKDIEWLRQHGQRISAEVIRVSRITYLRFNGGSPYVIFCKGHVSDTPIIFKSDMIGINPQRYITDTTVCPVLVDPTNPKRYYVDTTAILDQVNK